MWANEKILVGQAGTNSFSVKPFFLHKERETKNFLPFNNKEVFTKFINFL